MTGLKTLLLAALLLTSTSPTFAGFASDHPDTYEAENPDRGPNGALTPAGRMGLELPDGATPAFGASDAEADSDIINSLSCARRYRSYDVATRTFLGDDGYRHPCE